MYAKEIDEEIFCQEENCKSKMTVYCEIHELNGKIQHIFK